MKVSLASNSLVQKSNLRPDDQ